MTAIASAVAFIAFSCKQKLSEADKLNLSETPMQTMDSMYMLQTENGRVQMRVVLQFESIVIKMLTFLEPVN